MGCFEAAIFSEGTILDLERISKQALQNVLNQYDKQLPIEVQREIIGLPNNVWPGIVLNQLGADGSLEDLNAAELYSRWLDNMKNLSKNVLIQPGAEDLIEELHDRPKTLMSCITTACHPISHKHVFQYMDLIIYEDDHDILYQKPNPCVYNLIAERLEIDKKERVVVFENTVLGVTAAKEAGMYVIAIPDYRLDKELYSKADMVLESLQDFDIDEIMS